MKKTLLRASAAGLAVIGMAIAPAAAAAPVSLEAPAPAPVLIQQPGGGDTVSPMIAPCTLFSWFIFCRR